jgi:hypothetical protein
MNEPGVHYPHRIRLRDPWQRKPLGSGVRCSRRFGYPGRIDSDERVWLTVSAVQGRVEVSLNGRMLGSHDGSTSFEYDVTTLLLARNEVVMTFPEGADHWDEVALEVRRTAYLRGVRAVAEQGRMHVTGSVVGSVPRPLELYVLLDGHTVHYAQVEPGEFDVIAEGSGEQVRVELVDGGSVWYAVELPVVAR